MMSSSHNLLADAGTLSYHDKMIKNEMKKGKMLVDIFVDNYVS